MTEATEVTTEVQVSADGMSAEATSEGSLLAGKFKSQDDLIKGYKELEAKLGQPKPQPPAEEPTTAEAEATAEENTETPEGQEAKAEAPAELAAYGEVVGEAITTAGIDIAAAQEHFAENGNLSAEDMAKFAEAGFPESVVTAYLSGVASANAQAEGVAETQIAAIKDSVGGEAGYAELAEWMQANVPAAELEAFDASLETGDAASIQAAVTAFAERRATDLGIEGDLSGGRTAAAETGYATEAEFLEAMAKPEYKTSATYRDAVAAKLAKSNIFVTR